MCSHKPFPFDFLCWVIETENSETNTGLVPVSEPTPLLSVCAPQLPRVEYVTHTKPRLGGQWAQPCGEVGQASALVLTGQTQGSPDPEAWFQPSPRGTAQPRPRGSGRKDCGESQRQVGQVRSAQIRHPSTCPTPIGGPTPMTGGAIRRGRFLTLIPDKEDLEAGGPH